MSKLPIICAACLVAAGLAAATARADDKAPVDILLDSVTYTGSAAQVPVTILNRSGRPLAAQDVVCDFMADGTLAGRGRLVLPGVGAGARVSDIVSADVGSSAIDAVRCRIGSAAAARASAAAPTGFVTPFVK